MQTAAAIDSTAGTFHALVLVFCDADCRWLPLDNFRVGIVAFLSAGVAFIVKGKLAS